MKRLYLFAYIFAVFICCNAIPHKSSRVWNHKYPLSNGSWLNRVRQDATDPNFLYVSFDTKEPLTDIQMQELLKELDADELRIKMVLNVQRGKISYLNEVAKHFHLANVKLEKEAHEQLANLKSDRMRNSDISVVNHFYAKFFEAFRKQYSYQIGPAVCHSRDSSDLFKLSCPEHPDFIPSLLQESLLNLRQHSSQANNGMIRIRMDSDESMGDFEANVKTARLQSGKWKLWLHIDLFGAGYLPYDHRYFEAGLMIVGHRLRGYEPVYAKSNEVTRFSEFSKEERIDNRPAQEYADEYGFSIEQKNQRAIEMVIALPNIVPISGQPTVIKGIDTFTGFFGDAYNSQYQHRDSSRLNVNIFIDGDDTFDFVYNITAIANPRADCHHVDVELLYNLKGQPQSEASLLFKRKILQFTNAMPLIPSWSYAENMQVIVRKIVRNGVGYVRIQFEYPQSYAMRLESQRDVKQTKTIVEDRCPICFDDFEYWKEDDMELVLSDQEDGHVGYAGRKFPCKFPQCRHCAHESCVLAVMETNNMRDECPICRKKQNFFRIDYNDY